MNSRSIAMVVVAVGLLVGCNQNDRDTARERADQANAKAKHDLHELSTEARQDAHQLRNEIDKGMNGDVKPSTADARRKLDHAGDVARVEAERAGRTLDHATVVARVKAKLASDVGLSSVSRVKVDFSGGTVTLTGSVLSADQKRLAEQAAGQIEGVQHVDNQLTVEP